MLDIHDRFDQMTCLSSDADQLRLGFLHDFLGPFRRKRLQLREGVAVGVLGLVDLPSD